MRVDIILRLLHIVFFSVSALPIDQKGTALFRNPRGFEEAIKELL